MQVENYREQGVGAVSAAKTEIVTGEQVLELLLDENFLQNWSRLYEACPWATVFQSRAFVSAWYKVYHQEHLPILVKEELDGHLTGLLTLTKDVTGLGLTAAGGWDAYYHTWLTTDQEDGFIKRALATVRKQFPGQKIIFKYIPPHTPLSWLKTDSYWANRHISRPYLRPVMDFSAPDVAKLFSKKQFRENRNRLKRQGDLRFEQVTDLASFASMLDELTEQYDFRKAATLNKTPFRSNPLKKEFLLELYKQSILHVTVLRLNGEIVASLAATEGKNKWMHGSGINTHSPWYARLSPGYVIMVLLGQQLFSEGYQAFDLTPGGHEYKERLANAHDQLYELSITSMWSAYTTRFFYDYLKMKTKQLLSGTDISLKQIKSNISRNLTLSKEKLRLVPAAGLKAIWQQDKSRYNSGKGVELFRVDQIQLGKGGAVALQTNSLQDLLNFDPTGGHMTRWAFMVESTRRLEAGETCYSWAKGDRLIACVWVRASPEKTDGTSDGAVVLHDIYCHTRERHSFADFLSAVVAHLKKHGEQNPIFVVGSSADIFISDALRRTGHTKAAAQPGAA